MDSQADALRLIAEGDRCLQNGDLDGAEARYRKALEFDKGCTEGLYSIGCVCSRRGDYQMSLVWADAALHIDECHKGSQLLRGNALFGLKRYEEALSTLQAAELGEGDTSPRLQMGLLLEKLDRFQEAECVARSFLEGDPSYETRFQAVALHRKHPMYADAHHLLARVLQRQGNHQEAWLHYHLARRLDPVIDLDQMYREFLEEHDLENHPYFDVATSLEPALGASLTDKLKYLLQIKSYDSLSKETQRLRIVDDAPQLVGYIRASQESGAFHLSARLRAIGDVAEGKNAKAIVAALVTTSWARVFELAEMRFAKKLTPAEVRQQAASLAFEESSETDFVSLVRRFTRLSPETARCLAEVARGVLITRRRDRSRCLGELVWGEACAGHGDWTAAQTSLAVAAELVLEAGLYEWAMPIYEDLCRAYRQCGDSRAATGTAEKLVKAASRLEDPALEAHARALLAQCLGVDGDFHLAAIEARRALECAANGGVDGPFIDQLQHILQVLAPSLGEEPPELNEHSVQALLSRATSEMAAERYDEALVTLDRACSVALDQNLYADLVNVLTTKGRLLGHLERYEEASDSLGEALSLEAII